MRAYDLCMIIIFFNVGFAFLGAFFPDAFTDDISEHGDNILVLKNILTAELITIYSFTFTTMHALATLLVLGTILILNTTPGPSSQGYGYGIFSIVFWGGMTSTWGIINGFDIPGVDFIYTLFVLIATLVFIIALVQMTTGGQKTHV